MKLIDEGKEPPPQYYEQPELFEVARFYWDSFQDLSTERPIGMGLGPIPYSAIRRYGDEYGMVSRDEFDFFADIIQGMDTEFISMSNKIDKHKDNEMVSISDVQGQHLMFDRLKTRANSAHAKKR